MHQKQKLKINTNNYEKETEESSKEINIMISARIKMSKSWQFKFFLTIYIVFAIIESILIGFKHTGVAYALQIAILGFCTFMYLFGLRLHFNFLQAEIEFGEEVPLSKLLTYLLEGPTIFELICYLFGWATIFPASGLAVLRCLRLFRIPYYLTYYIGEEISDDFDISKYFQFFFEFSQIFIDFIKNLFYEIFSTKSMGGIILFFMFFYIAYLFAIIFWIEEGFNYSSTTTTNTYDDDLLNDDLYSGQYSNIDNTFGYCHNLNDCFILMIRLACLDSLGFDYLQVLMNRKQGGYTFLLFLFFIFMAMIIFNGLIGIFGRLFLHHRIVGHHPPPFHHMIGVGDDHNNNGIDFTGQYEQFLLWSFQQQQLQQRSKLPQDAHTSVNNVYTSIRETNTSGKKPQAPLTTRALAMTMKAPGGGGLPTVNTNQPLKN
jgi:hypothetical protein